MRRTIIIGDIHSCADELFELLDKAVVTDEDTVVAAGDIFDRGPDPWRVFEYFSAGLSNRLAVLGNHDRKHRKRYLSASQRITKLMLGEERYQVIREWLKTLPLWLDLPEALVVHGAYCPGTPMEEQDPSLLVGHLGGEQILKRLYPNSEWWEHHEGPKPVVFGHHVQRAVELKPGLVYGVDGGCAKGGYLHALILPEKKIVSVKAKTNYWQHAKEQYAKIFVPDTDLKTTTWAKLRRFSKATYVPVADRREFRYWLKNLKNLAENVAARAKEVSAELTEGAENRGHAWEQVRDHGAAPLLIQAFAGELDARITMAKCSTPEKLLSAAMALDVNVDNIPQEPITSDGI